MPAPILDAIRSRVLVFDGAMGTALHGFDLDVQRDFLGRENCVDLLSLTRPDVVAQVHRGYLDAGCDAVSTNSFGAAAHTLAEFDLADRCAELNEAAARLARRCVSEFASSGSPRFVLGSMGPGTRLITLGQIDWETMLRSYTEQARGLIAGGVDALLIETCQDPLQIRCAVCAATDALEAEGRSTDDVPIFVSLTFEQQGTMLVGTSVEAAGATLANLPVAALGLNCATGPDRMEPHLAWLSRNWDRPLFVQPNAGLPELRDGRTRYPLTPAQLAEALRRFVDQYGVCAVGGCCGTTAAHLRAVVDALTPRPAPAPRPRPALAGAASSLYASVPFRQDTSFLIIGERLNASGSRKFRALLDASDYDGIVSLAREQVQREGAHVLDINVDDPQRDNRRDMAEIVRRLATQVDAPLMLDSTQPDTIEAGLRSAPGKCIINSANFEEGTDKFDALCALARRYGAALVIGSIDEDPEQGMARTADRKLQIARRAYERATSVHGLHPQDLFFDPLVLPVSTGLEPDRANAAQTIEGTRLIAQEFPDCQTIVGLSNVSFGLRPAARVVLNSAFLHELLAAGLTSAIVHAGRILPENRIDPEHWSAAMDLLYDRRTDGQDPLQRFVDLFADAQAQSAASAAAGPRTLEERLRDHIILGEKEGLETTLTEALTRYDPLAIINDHLLDGMKTVGDLFGSGRMQLPFVLQSAEVMKRAVAFLQPHLPRTGGAARARIVLATVRGDVHDIGKNLVDIILSNNGFEVVNLGIKQPVENIIEAAQKHRANAIGLSGLLVKSVHVMEENLQELNKRGITTPVLLGGAALSRHYAESHLRSVYRGPCFYGKDAFEGLSIMRAIAEGNTEEIQRQIEHRLRKRDHAERVAARAPSSSPPRGVPGVEPVEPPSPPFWGTRVVDDLAIEDVYPYINTTALFRGQWQFRKGPRSDQEYQRFLDEHVRPIFERVKARCHDVLRPRVVYGYFPCRSEGNDLVVLDPADHARALERFSFPRQRGRQALCIADFFRSDTTDVLAMQCVTVGPEVSRLAQRLFARDEYAEYLYVHGLGVETAEALAELWHQRVRRELGIADADAPDIRGLCAKGYRGCRYSFGYPACPEMRDQEKLWRLLDPGRIGCALTENWQIDPEQSTSALIAHHPRAKYFAI